MAPVNRSRLGVAVPGLLILLGFAWCSPRIVLAQDPIQRSAPVLDTLEGQFVRDIQWQDLSLLGNAAQRAITAAAESGRGIPPEHQGLFAASERAYLEETWNQAYRYVVRALLVVRGEAVTEGTEVASSLDLMLRTPLFEPAQSMVVSLQPSFTLGGPLSQPYTATLSLTSSSGELISEIASISMHQLAEVSVHVDLGGLEPGTHGVGYRLETPDGETLVDVTRGFIVAPRELRRRAAILRATLDQLVAQDIGTMDGRRRTAAETIAWVVAAVEGALTDYAEVATIRPMTAQLVGRSLRQTPDPANVEKDLALAEVLAAALLAGEDPLSGRTGDVRLAYRSEFDGALQPFRVFLPEGFDPARRYPMVVALHGAGGDENIYMERYLVPVSYFEDRERAIQELRDYAADRGPAPPEVPETVKTANLFTTLGGERGYILVAPRGRGPMSGYRGPGEMDVLAVLDRMLQIYPVRRDQVFLTGHSMGGGGTWWIGLRYPERFAALAPVAGGGQVVAEVQAQLSDAARSIPVFFVQGGRDRIVPPERSRRGAEVAKRILDNFTYREYPEEDHFIIGVATMEDILDFFDAQRR